MSLNWVKGHEIQILLREAKIFSAKAIITHKPSCIFSHSSFLINIMQIIADRTVHEIKLGFVHLSDHFQGSYLEDFTIVRGPLEFNRWVKGFLGKGRDLSVDPMAISWQTDQDAFDSTKKKIICSKHKQCLPVQNMLGTCKGVNIQLLGYSR